MERLGSILMDCSILERMEKRIFSSGTGRANSLSKRPARRRPGSRFSGLELADMTNVWSSFHYYFYDEINIPNFLVISYLIIVKCCSLIYKKVDFVVFFIN